MTDSTQPEVSDSVLAGDWGALPEENDDTQDHTRQHGLFGFGWIRRYGGHPVVVRIGARRYGRRLFVGGRERTMRLPRVRRARPSVDVIVNLCDLPDHPAISAPGDLWWPRGEGPLGYQPDVLLRDATTVADLLRGGSTVLVHCVAGVNRAPTLCTAIIMVLEQCTAREALRTVRQRRWMALPDPWHWRTLRRLEGLLVHNAEISALTTRSA